MRKTDKLEDLIPDDRNANRHTERGNSMLEKSLEETGAGRGIVSDKNGKMIAGNQVLQTAMEKGFKARFIRTKGDEIIVNVREDLDLDDKDPNNPARKLAYYDNRTSELGLAWDEDQIVADIQAGFDFNDMFYEDEMKLLVDDFSGFKEYDETLNADAPKYTCPNCDHQFRI